MAPYKNFWVQILINNKTKEVSIVFSAKQNLMSGVMRQIVISPLRGFVLFDNVFSINMPPLQGLKNSVLIYE